MYSDFNILSFKLAISLLVVFALMILFFFILKRLKGGTLSARNFPAMRNIATLSLAPKRSLALVEVCDQWILVGVGVENISLISEINRPAEDSQFYKNLPGGKNSFAALLSKAGMTGRDSEGSSDKK